MCFDMSLLLLTVILRGVSNKHCLLPLFSFLLLKDYKDTFSPRNLCHLFYISTIIYTRQKKKRNSKTFPLSFPFNAKMLIVIKY